MTNNDLGLSVRTDDRIQLIGVGSVATITDLNADVRKALAPESMRDVEKHFILRRYGVTHRMAAIAGHESTRLLGRMRVDSTLAKSSHHTAFRVCESSGSILKHRNLSSLAVQPE